MNFNTETLDHFIVPAGMLVSGIIIGFIVEKIFLLNIKRMAIKARWDGGRVIINSLRGITFLWFIMAGIYGAILNYEGIGPKTFSHLKLGISIVLILSITWVVSRLGTGFVKLYTGRVLPSNSIFINLTKVFVFVLGMLVLLQTLGISVAPIITALGVGGLAVALALQDTLSNLFAGLHIIASKKVKTGDYIRLDSGGEGILEDITWRNTAIRTLANNTIIVPNSKMASAVITNFNIPSKDLDIPFVFGISHQSNLEHVEKVTMEVAKDSITRFPNGKIVSEPIVRFIEITEAGVNMQVTFRGKELTDQGVIKHIFIKMLHQKFKEEGITSPVTSRNIFIHNQ